MTYIEHARDCQIFRLDRIDGAGCNCRARYARAPEVMGPHEEFCLYLTQEVTLAPHGICNCAANPDHDDTCTGTVCWDRRKGVWRTDRVA